MGGPSAREHDRWARVALIRTLTGTVVGVLIAATLHAIIWLFPGVEDFDNDFGMVARLFVTELRHRSSAIPSSNEQPGFVFVDIDPDRAPPGANSACDALTKAHPGRYTIVEKSRGLSPARGTGHEPREGVQLDCGSGRPLNRYLLSEIIAELQKRNPRTIVVDVELDGEPGVVTSEETQALARALSGSQVPTVYVLPVDDPEVLHPPVTFVHVVPSALRLGQAPHAFATVALAEPGVPVRRYAKCYRDDTGDRWIPSLPFQAASTLRAALPTDGDTLCRAEIGVKPAELTARIDYTLPSLAAHAVDEDADLVDQRFALRTIYRHLYIRCLASDFWPGGSAQSKRCSLGETYAGRVVVIGASNQARRDTHPTPFGPMAGAEVVMNAMQTFAKSVRERDTSLGKPIGELGQLILSSLLWLPYFGLKSFLQRKDDDRKPTRRIKAGRAFLLAPSFVLVLFAVLLITIARGYASLSIVVGVIGLAAEQYLELATQGIHFIEGVLERWLLGPKDAAHKGAGAT
jgi:CHASE2 domain-containing sensor protein